MVMNKLTINNA